MAVVHVYPASEESIHCLTGCFCTCEPSLEWYDNGATVVIHNRLDN